MAGLASGGMDVGQLLADQLVKAAKVVEEQLDAELNKLDNMDEDEMEALVSEYLGTLTIVRCPYAYHV